MRCPYCNEETGNDEYCRYCGMPTGHGHDLDDDNLTNIIQPGDENRGFQSDTVPVFQDQPSRVAPARPARKQTPPNRPASSQFPVLPQSPAVPVQKKRKSRKGMIFGGLGVLALCVFVGVMFAFIKPAPSGDVSDGDPEITDQLNTKISAYDGKVSAAFTGFEYSENSNPKIEFCLTNETADEPMSIEIQTVRVNGLYIDGWMYCEDFQPGDDFSVSYTLPLHDFNDDVFGRPLLIEVGFIAESQDGNTLYDFTEVAYAPEGEEEAYRIEFGEDDYSELLGEEFGILLGRSSLLDFGDGDYMIRLGLNSDLNETRFVHVDKVKIDGKELPDSEYEVGVRSGSGLIELIFYGDTLKELGINPEEASQVECDLDFLFCEENADRYTSHLRSVSFDLP